MYVIQFNNCNSAELVSTLQTEYNYNIVITIGIDIIYNHVRYFHTATPLTR